MDEGDVGIGALTATRRGWHEVAEHVLAPAVHAATGHIGLRAAPGGFATPWFESVSEPSGRARVRVDGLDLVVEVQGGNRPERRARLTTVGAAAVLVGIAPGLPGGVYPPATALDPDRALELDGAAAHRLADLYAAVDQALGALAGPDATAQLWPEHFDLALELDQVNYGGSPGDASHAEPYLYVGPWSPPPTDGRFWNESFGASIPAPAALTAAEASAFFERGRRLLT